MMDEKDNVETLKTLFFIWLPEKMQLKNMTKVYHLIILYKPSYIILYIPSTLWVRVEVEEI